MNQDTGSRAAEAPPKADCPRGDLYGHEGGGSDRGTRANSPPEMPPLVEDITAGAEATALSMIVVAVKHQQGVVYNPGGYLRGILNKISSGNYQLLPSVYGVTAEER